MSTSEMFVSVAVPPDLHLVYCYYTDKKDRHDYKNKLWWAGIIFWVFKNTVKSFLILKVSHDKPS